MPADKFSGKDILAQLLRIATSNARTLGCVCHFLRVAIVRCQRLFAQDMLFLGDGC